MGLPLSACSQLSLLNPRPSQRLRLMPTMDMPTTHMVLDMPTMDTTDTHMPTTVTTMARDLLMLSQRLMLMLTTDTTHMPMDTISDMPTMDTTDTHMPTTATDITTKMFSRVEDYLIVKLVFKPSHIKD